MLPRRTLGEIELKSDLLDPKFGVAKSRSCIFISRKRVHNCSVRGAVVTGFPASVDWKRDHRHHLSESALAIVCIL